MWMSYKYLCTYYNCFAVSTFESKTLVAFLSHIHNRHVSAFKPTISFTHTPFCFTAYCNCILGIFRWETISLDFSP